MNSDELLAAREFVRSMRASHGRQFATDCLEAALDEVERLTILAKSYLDDGIVAMQESQQLQVQVGQLAGALHDLADVQNGSPLPSYETDWTTAMTKTWTVLAAYEASEEKHDA